MTSPHSTCDYCGLSFSGPGYSPDIERHYCCCGCYLVQQITGSRGDEGIASWLLIRMGIGASLAMYVMMISLALYANSASELGTLSVRDLHWGLLILSTPAVVILGSPFLIGGMRDLLRRRLSTDVLIVTGAMTAYGVSTVHVIRGTGHVYYDTATMLLLIVTLGRLIEASAKNKTSKSLQKMMELMPAVARVLRDGEEVEIASADVKQGDVMVVRPGERLPADGKILQGNCLVEQAAFSGEANPRPCSPGDSVFGGSVNCDGLIMVQAAAVGSESLLAQIKEAVRRAQSERAPIERLAGRATAVFVPIVWITAIGAAVYWGGFRHDTERAGLSALAVLVVACPCALGIATPIATCIAIGRAARAGVLIRSGEVLERLPSIKHVFFDKTGTLTFNTLAVTDIRTAGDDIGAEEALQWAATLESGSEHTVARAITAAAHERGLALGQIEQFQVHPGRGVQGTITCGRTSRELTVGSLALLTEKHAVNSALAANNDPEASTIYVGWNNEVQAAMTLSAAVRPEAINAIESLAELGIRSAIISGDQKGPTEQIARELGISEIIAECGPLHKAEIIRKTRRAGTGGVAMVGDGINDAPALTEADVGIALGGSTDLARQSSDVTLLGDDLTQVAEVLQLSRRTYHIIRQNLWWAFGYNSITISLASMGFVHPLIAAAMMVVSSLTVIVNSVRLLKGDGIQMIEDGEGRS